MSPPATARIAASAGFAGNQQARKEKGVQPLRVVGRQKRVFARVPGGKPARADHIFG
jgi:hypothetical protein